MYKANIHGFDLAVKKMRFGLLDQVHLRCYVRLPENLRGTNNKIQAGFRHHCYEPYLSNIRVGYSVEYKG